MTANVNIISLSLGKGIVLDVDFSKFNEEVREHLMLIGAKNVLRDVHAGVKDEQEARAKSENKLQALYRGELQARNGTSAILDAQREEIARLKAELEKAQKAASKPAKR